MELTIAVAISIISVIITVLNFAFSRKEKAVKDAKETNMALINYRLDELDKNVQKILDKLEKYESETDDKIQKALKQHVEIYHKKG